jgi:threonine synthase
MFHYFYKCFSCHKEFNASKIESDIIYLCTDCGKAERNKPLQGTLEVIYDYDNIRKNLSADRFLKNSPGKFWLYPQLWPLPYSMDKDQVTFNKIDPSVFNKIKLNSSFYEYTFRGKTLSFLDDTLNPTLSYKDRASTLVALKALQLGIKNIAAASTGNAGSSIAGICARLGLKAHIFVPESIPDAKRIQIQSFGANLYMVAGSYDDAFDLCLEISSSENWYVRNTAYNPLTIEGKKSAAFDIFIMSKGNIPDKIFIPVGDGVILTGVYKGFTELLNLGWIEKMPELIAVQASGSDAVVKYIEKGIFSFSPAHTIADSISTGVPRNLFMAADAVKMSCGKACRVTDDEILSAQKIMAENFGLLAEPASSAAFAGYIKMNDSGEIGADEKVLLLITGNGLKDIISLEKWNSKPEARTQQQLKASFGIR